jgi:hypothetical protein
VARTVVTLKLLAGDFTLVGEIKPIGRNGQPPEGFSTCSNWQSLQQITWGFDNEFAEGMSLQITIFSGFDEVTVPFEFADLSVVPEPKRNSVMTWGPPPPPAGATRDFTSDDAPPRHGVVFGDSFEDALKQAEGDGRRVLLYCSGDFCTYCRKMERETLTDPDVMASAAKTVSVKLDATRQNPLSEKYEVKVLPTTLVLTADGTVIDRCQGYQSAPEFREWLDAALAKSAIATDESAEKPAATSKTR